MLFFQIVIVGTILATRFAAPKYLAIVCAAWTAFTLVAVYTSPLLVLQLVTIWGSYILLRPGGTAPAAEPRWDVHPRPETASTKAAPSVSEGGPAETQPAKPRLPGPLRKIAEASERLSLIVERQAAIEKATGNLEIAVAAERRFVEAMVSISRRKAEIERTLDRDENLRRLYNEIERDFDNDLAADRTRLGIEKPKLKVPAVLTPARFDFPPRHADAQAADAIEAKITALKQERDRFFSALHTELRGDAPLRDQLRSELREDDADGIWAFLVEVETKGAGIIGELASRATARKMGAHSAATTGVPPRSVPGSAAGTAGARQASASTSDALHDLAAGTTIGTLPFRRHSLRTRIEGLQIPFLVHFTQAANLPAIMEHGLLPVSALRERNIRPAVNDQLRLDGHPDAICLSVGHPNDKMLYKYRQLDLDRDWAVLVLDPSILWTHDAAFCRYNAADKRMIDMSRVDLGTVDAFDALFADGETPTRAAQGLRRFDPTDVQAEVLVFDSLPADCVRAIVFDAVRAKEKYAVHLGNRRLDVHLGSSGFFAARSYVRRAGWTF